MAGRITKAEQQLEPDPRHEDKVLSRFINCMMKGGNKATATPRRLQRTRRDPEASRQGKQRRAAKTSIDLFHQALDRVRPSVEVRSKRVGGANYQVPIQVNRRRQQSMTFRWIITAVREEKGKPVHLRLAQGTDGCRSWRGQGRHHPREHPPHGRREQGVRPLRLVTRRRRLLRRRMRQTTKTG